MKKNPAPRNTLTFFILLLFLVFFRHYLDFQQFCGVIIAIVLYFMAVSLRKSLLFDFMGLPVVSSVAEISDRPKLVSFLVRKSTWIFVPLLYVVLNPSVGLSDLGLVLETPGLVQLILMGLLSVFSIIMFLDAKDLGINLQTYLRSFLLSFLAAGFPEDLLIIGLIGGRVLGLLNCYFPAFWAKILTLILVDSLFSLSHIGVVKGAKRFYSEYMTRKLDMSWQRMFFQMFIVGVPGWIFYFLSSHIYFSAWWHTLVDIAVFLPRVDGSTK